MNSRKNRPSRRLQPARTAIVFLAALFLAAPAFAQGGGNSPWENAVSVLQTAFTSTIARGLSLVAIVVAGLTFAFERSAATSPIPSIS
jgi:type IV secretion system protein TrbC